MKNYIDVDEHNLAIQNMLKHVDFEDKQVLDIGCGDGRMSFKIAQYAKSVIGIDPDVEEIKLAEESQKTENMMNLKFHAGTLEDMDFGDNTFDIIVFSLSLCCIANTDNPFRDKLELIHDVWKLLKPSGILVNQLYNMRFDFNNPGSMIWYLLSGEDIHLSTYVRAERSTAALKYATLVENKFKFIAEEVYPIDWYLNGREGAINEFVGLEEYEKLDGETKLKIDEVINKCITKNGDLLEKGDDVLTIVQKIE
ncbi:MAG: class I SAM-dependent methyltransferase [Candidatus Heimdallarchaeota archaeon]|nr:class I SAM-dependent methyltransferase [Candidatus Heimdallarchaeota archaeon]